MIGKIYSSVVPFYDRKAQKNGYKKRPVLIIAGPRNNDYTILPISTVSIKENLDSDYDVEVDPGKYPLLNLKQLSYIRVHKQTTVHQASLTTEISDLREAYGDLYIDVLARLEKYNEQVISQAL